MAQAKDRFVILFLPVLFLLGGCSGGEAQVAASRSNAASLPPKQGKLAKSEARRLTHTVTAPGTLAADEQATLSFQVAGRVSEIKIDIGSQARQSQILGILDTTE